MSGATTTKIKTGAGRSKERPREPGRCLTDELNGLVQPGKQLLTVVVIDRNAHEVTVTDEVWLGAGVAGIEDVAYSILSHQVLVTEKTQVMWAQSVQSGTFPSTLS